MRIQNALHATLLKLLRPLARVMLSHGMSHGAFAELSRQAFVEEGFNHMARAGKRPTISGVAAVTGLSRKEVKRLNELDPEALTASSQRRNRAIRVLSGWVNDPQFQHEGQPAVLQLDGRESSFAELVKRYGGDVPTMAMLSLLCDSGSVMADQDRVTLLKKAYIPMATPLDRLNILGTDAGELISTIGHNMMAAPADRLFQRKVSNALVRKDALPEFREMSNRRSQELLEEYDAWLSEREVSNRSADQNEAAYVAVGIYYVEHSDEEASP
ncbi:DUF6502 family protein [Halieaceae bacterium]|nr:DUF6502 family protein [Halieaceae bacterium]